MSTLRPDIVTILGSISDPRLDRTKAHNLCSILVGTLVAVMCGCDSYVEVADFMESQTEWLSKFVDMSNGAPSHDTVARVFRLLDPVSLSKAFQSCLELLQVKLNNKVIAIDGKCLRGSHDRASNQNTVYMVSAWAVEAGLVLGQVKVDEKSNEITAIPELLSLLDLRGAIITIDAMGTQRKIAELITESGGDYVLAVKANQRELHDAVKSVMDIALDTPHDGPEPDVAQSMDNLHGRMEVRRYAVLSADAIEWAEINDKWAGLASIIVVESKVTKDDKTTTERRYYISSLRPAAKRIGKAIRSHWGIENSLHWVLDVIFNEDRSRIRKDNGPENMVVTRHMVLNLLKRESAGKTSIKRKRNKAAFEPQYRELLLKI